VRTRTAQQRPRALYLVQAAIGHLNTLLIQIVLAEPAWRGRLTGNGRHGLPALSWTRLHLCGRLEPGLGRHFDLGFATTM
jgi:hypothetical protein